MAYPPAPPLKQGDLIGVMAPSGFVEPGDIEKSQAALEERGYEVFVHEQTYARLHQSAGTTAEKLDALHELYVRENVNAIWAAGGGNRALYMLDGLDYELIAQNPKPLIGFSDVTALLNAIYAHTGIPGYHAQVFKALHRFEQLDDTLEILAGERPVIHLDQCEVLRPGHAAGRLVGGCLSLFHYLPGTNDCPNLRDAILFLEDAGDELSRFDRMFAHMKRMGVFEQIGGLILGEFLTAKDTGNPFGFELEEIVMELTEEREIPVLSHAPFGHGDTLLPLPVGVAATLDTAGKSLDTGKLE
ncbi:MAG: LD-carboxypeptidase [Alphaproteobacteria bacterium]